MPVKGVGACSLFANPVRWRISVCMSVCGWLARWWRLLPGGWMWLPAAISVESPQAQAEEITAVAETGVRAVVLVSNRLDPRQDGDAVWLQRAETLLSRLPQELMLGVYECPQLYKRLLTPVILDWCVETGRFAFIKDTCCDPAELTARLQRLRGTGVGLFNANEQTLLHSLQQGRGDIPGSWRISIRSCWCGCAISGSGSRRRRSGYKTI